MTTTLAIVVVVSQWAAGSYAWWLLGRRARLPEILGVGLALGTAVSALSGVLAWRILGPVWGSLLPSLLMAAVAVGHALRTVIVHRTSPTARTFRSPPVDLGEGVALGIGLVVGVIAIIANLSRYPVDIARGSTSFHQDMVFFQPLSRSLAMVGPDDSIFMSGHALRYHWLSYAWAGDLDAVAGTEPFVVLTRLLPLTALLACVLLTVAWTRRLTPSRWAPTLAVILLVSGGYVGATYGTILNFDSPSQEFSTMWMLGLTVALWRLLPATTSVTPTADWLVRTRWQSSAVLVVITLLGAAATGGKVSAGAVILAAWGLLTVVALIRRETFRWWALGGLLAGSVGAGWIFLRYIAGSAQGGGIGMGSLLERASSVQGLNPMAGTVGVILGTCILALAIAGRWAGLAWLIGDRGTRWSPGTIFGAGLTVIGLATIFLLSGGLNDTWFALAASAPLCAISAWGTSDAVRATNRAWARGRELVGRPPVLPWVGALVAGVLLLVVVLLLWTLGPNTGTNMRWAGPVVAVVGALVAGGVIARFADRPIGTLTSRDRRRHGIAVTIVVLVTMAALARVLGLAADRFGVPADFGRRSTEFALDGPFLGIRDGFLTWTWSADQAAAGAWLAARPEAGLVATNQTRSPLVAMLSGRQTLISAVQYQAPYGTYTGLGDALVRDGDSWRFIQTPDVEHGRKLCEQGVRWIWVDPTRTDVREWSPYASIVFQRPDVIILFLDPSLCTDS